MFCIGEEKKLIFDISEAGTGLFVQIDTIDHNIHYLCFRLGKLMVKIKHNNNNNNNSFEELPLEQTGSYKYKMLFKPKFCGKFIHSLR